MPNNEVSVIIPAYNEEARISQTLMEVVNFFTTRAQVWEIIVVDDGSTDHTAEEIRRIARIHSQVKIHQSLDNQGKGIAVREGMKMASLGLHLFMDADNSTSIYEWEKMEPLFDQGFDAVIASRHAQGSNIVQSQPMMRRFLGTGYRSLCRNLFGVSASDINCGFKAFRAKLSKEIFPNITMSDWTFDLEILYLLKQRGVSIAEIPVRWEHRDKATGIAPISTAMGTFGSLVKLKRRFSIFE